MKKNKPKVAYKLHTLLQEIELKEFTVLKLRDEFQVRFGLGEFQTSSNLRKCLYRRVYSLVKKGHLIKLDQEVGTPCLYRIEESYAKNISITNIASASPANDQQQLLQRDALKSKFNQYQVDMLACTGECKEYQQLAEELPHLRERIEPMYRKARERSSELMGHLQAISNLLQHSGYSE